jgi:hypothetical protein
LAARLSRKALSAVTTTAAGFVSWLWGAGIRPASPMGRAMNGATRRSRIKTYCYDLHATVLHLLGIDHEKLTVRQNGIDRRLTDVHGHVVREVLA